jgi:hypothetical protein
MQAYILTGHLGSGKTEIAINLALRMTSGAQQTAHSSRVVLVDIDVVNPYFAAREARELLESHGVQLAAPSEKTITADIPALSKDIYQSLHGHGNRLILDAGGDPAGARILRGLRLHLEETACSVYCVVNTKRPSTSTPEGIFSYIEQIGAASGLGISALIHNTHLLHETSEEDIYTGQALVEAVSHDCELPIAYTTLLRELAPRVEGHIANDILVMERYLLPPYERSWDGAVQYSEGGSYYAERCV